MRAVYHNGVVVSSARLLAAVSRSHLVATRVDVLFNRAVIASEVAITGGSITYDRNAAMLARFTAQLVEGVVPLGIGSTLTPYGYELQVWSGVRFVDGDDLVSLGVFPIQTADAEGIGIGTGIAAADRSQLVIDARFENDYSVAAGTNYATAIQTVLNDGVPGLDYSQFAATAHTTPLLVFGSQSDRWESAQSMARSIGMDLYFDGLGRPVLRPEPDLSTTEPALTVAEGPGGVLTEITLHLDRGPAYNRVIANSENASTGDVFRGVWTDDDPASPTYYDGPFGRKPRFYSSPFLNSDAQCADAARAIGLSNIGIARSLGFALAPNPVVEAGDVVLLKRAQLGIDEVQIIDSYSYGLGALGTMSCESRARQVVAA